MKICGLKLTNQIGFPVSTNKDSHVVRQTVKHYTIWPFPTSFECRSILYDYSFFFFLWFHQSSQGLRLRTNEETCSFRDPRQGLVNLIEGCLGCYRIQKHWLLVLTRIPKEAHLKQNEIYIFLAPSPRLVTWRFPITITVPIITAKT